MSSREILVLTSAYERREGDEKWHNYIQLLLDAPENERSPRENDVLQRMHEFGEIYAMTVEENDGFVLYRTDLGSCDAIVEVKVPSMFANERKVADLVQLLAEGLIQ